MGKYLLGILTVIIIVAVGCGGILIFDLVGIVKKNDLIFTAVEQLTGLKNFQENYELGQKRSRVLKKKETELVTKEKRLASREQRLEADLAELENQKQLWFKEHPIVKQPEPKSVVAQNKPRTEDDPKLKNYLATIGAMKAEKAAAVIQKLPDETVFLIFDQLRANQASKLMENLPPEYLTRLTEARLNQHK
ncbi:MAG TPA: hypothetical protein VEC37_05925 [Bacillota bacterium]|nr:hypothetical protein [Bacillota bacterium]